MQREPLLRVDRLGFAVPQPLTGTRAPQRENQQRKPGARAPQRENQPKEARGAWWAADRGVGRLADAAGTVASRRAGGRSAAKRARDV